MVSRMSYDISRRLCGSHLGIGLDVAVPHSNACWANTMVVVRGFLASFTENFVGLCEVQVVESCQTTWVAGDNQLIMLRGGTL